ncbi:MAG: hypothetical protein Q8936_14195 [Bacillota bacterium]|nr:hypothetical protein [Bacillota bacterium]
MELKEAYQGINCGKKIRRKSWPNNAYLKSNSNDELTMYHIRADLFTYDLSIIHSHGWICITNHNRSEPIDFISGLQYLNEGMKLRLQEWPDSTYLMIDNRNIVIFKEEEWNFVPTYECLIAHDWEIID